MRVKRKLQCSPNIHFPAAVNGSAFQTNGKIESSQSEGLKQLKRPFVCRVGAGLHTIKKAWFVPHTRQTIVTFESPWRQGEWVAVHFESNYGIVFGAPSRRYILRLMELILPRMNLAKCIRGFWDDAKDALGETISGYLQHVWRAEYDINELPTVKQWLRSGLKNSHQKWTPCRGRMMVRKAKR